MPFSALVGNVIAAPFSIVLLPDTQYYAANPVYGLYNAQAQWIVANKETQAIAFVIHLGDMTNANLDSEWSVVRAAHDLLDTADIPCSVIPGNHDYYGVGATRWHEVFRRDLTKYNKNFGPRSFSGKSWYGGNMGNTADQNENNYCFFSSDGLDFMVVSLEYAPRKDTLTWANQLIGRHPKHRVILVTHAYLTHNGAYTNGAGPEYGIIGSGGTDLWNECASRHSNVFLVVCGHVGESAVNEKKGVAGNTLYEMVVDYQFEKKLNNTPNLGNGWLRILTLHPDAHRIDATPLTVASGDSTIFVDGIDRFYEPDYDPSPTHSDHTFSLHYNMGDMGVYCYMNASTGFHDREVNPIVTGNQRNPDIGQSAAGDWAAVWEDDSEGNGMFTIHVRGFDADGNERFPDTVVNTFGGNTTSATNPSLAMCPDGRFVVAFQSGSTDIRVRTHAADGTPMDSVDWPVVSTATGTVRNPDVAMDERGNFIVVWEDDSDGNGSYQVRARGFGWDGTERFPAKTVNTISAGQQINPVIAMAPNGDYVVAWDDDQENDDSFEIGARGFYTNEQEMFAQMFANNTTVGQQRNPDVAMDASGRCLVIWEDDADMNGVYQIKARGFSADGSQLLPEMTVNLLAAGNQINPAVTMDASGNWFAVWEDNRVGEGYQIVSQVFSLSGERVFSADVQVNTVSTVKYGSENPRRQDPVISIHRSGRYVVAWADDMDGDGSFEILARGVTGTARSLAIKSIHGSVGRTLSDVFYKEGESVLLNATPDAGFHFIRWQGDCPPGAEYNNPLILVVDSNKVLEAVFAPCKGLSWCFY
jgi:hypothetical protein